MREKSYKEHVMGEMALACALHGTLVGYSSLEAIYERLVSVGCLPDGEKERDDYGEGPKPPPSH